MSGILEQILTYMVSIDSKMDILTSHMQQVPPSVIVPPVGSGVPPVTTPPVVTPPNSTGGSSGASAGGTGSSLALKGINIGNDQNAYKAAQNQADLSLLKGKVGRVRVAFTYGKDQNDLNNLKQLALDAKKQGFFVQFGITAGAEPSVTSYYNQWLNTDVVNLASWAQANHIDEFSIGNEEDHNAQFNGAFKEKTPTQIRNDVKTLVGRVKAVYSGQVVYVTSELVLDDWIREGRGPLDRIYFNVYDTDVNFGNLVSKIASNFGVDHAGLAEWAAFHQYGSMGMSPDQYRSNISMRAKIVKNSGLPAYFFTLRMNGDGGTDDWGLLLKDGTQQPGLQEVLNY
jgi:hypothetical protein